MLGEKVYHDIFCHILALIYHKILEYDLNFQNLKVVKIIAKEHSSVLLFICKNVYGAKFRVIFLNRKISKRLFL